MKNKIIILTLILLSLCVVACSKKQISTKEDVIKFVEEKGKENVDWKDFEHLKHSDVASGIIGEKYILSDGNYLLLSGISYENKPESIRICDSNNKIVKELK